MKKKLGIFIILLLSICVFHISSNAQSFTLETDPKEKIVEPGELVEIKLSVRDITDIDEGINTLVGYMEYEEDFFESMEFSGANKWNVTYNDAKKNKLYGKFAITTLQNGILEEEQIATVNLKLKGNLPDGETEIKFKSLTSSDGYNSISEEDRIVKLIIKNPTEEIKEEKPKKEPIANKTEEKVDKPQNIITGDNIFLYIGIISIVVVVNSIIFVVLKNNKNNK